MFGHPWVNPDTLATLRKHGTRRTGPKGESLDGDAALAKAVKR